MFDWNSAVLPYCFSRLAAASDRLKKLHELVNLAHQQSAAFAETGEGRDHLAATDTRLEMNHVSTTLSPQQPRTTSVTSHDVTRTVCSRYPPNANDDLRREQQSNRYRHNIISFYPNCRPDQLLVRAE